MKRSKVLFMFLALVLVVFGISASAYMDSFPKDTEYWEISPDTVYSLNNAGPSWTAWVADNAGKYPELAGCQSVTYDSSLDKSPADADLDVDVDLRSVSDDVYHEYQVLDWDITDQNPAYTIKYVLVKGGNDFNLYDYTDVDFFDDGDERYDQGLMSPTNPNGYPANVSHVTFYYTENYTTIDAEVTAEGSWENNTDYEWTLDKSVEPASATLDQEESATFNYTLDITKSAGEEESIGTITGSVAVDNTGDFDTQGLQVKVELYLAGDPETLLESKTLDLDPDEVAAGDTESYDFSFDVVPSAGAEYVVKAYVTIDNGDDGDSASDVTDSFGLGQPQNTETDASASLTDVLDADDLAALEAAGFEVTGGFAGTDGDLTDDANLTYSVTVKNIEAAQRNAHFDLKNVATLDPSDDENDLTDDETITIYTEGDDQEEEVTSISTDINGSGTWQIDMDYDWTITKSVSDDTIKLGRGEEETIQYTLVVTRTADPDPENHASITGTASVTNTGDYATDGLAVVIGLYEAGDPDTLVSGKTLTYSPDDLAVEASWSQPFTFDFTYESGVTYLVKISADIDNGAAAADESGVQLYEAKGETTDETAVLNDILDDEDMDGFIVTRDLPDEVSFPLTLEGTTEITYDVTIENESADKGESFDLLNTATLQPLTLGQTSTTDPMLTDDEKVVVTTPGGGSNHRDNDNDDDDDVDSETIIDNGIPEAPPVTPVTPPKEVIKEKDVPQEEILEEELPKAGGIPVELFYGFGMMLAGAGYIGLKRK